MLKRLLISIFWLNSTLFLLLTSMGIYYQKIARPKLVELEIQQKQAVTIAQDNQAQEEETQAMESEIELDDARAEIVANFLQRYNSPMKPYDHYGQFLVDVADKNGLDFRLMPAIAMQESNLCKNNNPGAPHNCLGFGIHKRGTLDFESYEAGFERAAREIKERYVDIGLETPEEIMSKYTPSSNGSWAESVKQWMAEMKYDDRGKGITEKTNESVLKYAK